MDMHKLYFIVEWRRYFDQNQEQIKKHLTKGGITIYDVLCDFVSRAAKRNLKEQVVALDELTRTVLSIPREDYAEILTRCIDYYVSIEKYEECAEIQKTIDIFNKKKKTTSKIKHKTISIEYVD